jgi:hypothetical protein
VLFADLPAGEVQEHVVEGGAMCSDGAHRHAGGGHDRADGRFLVGHERGEAALGALDPVTRPPQ